jgi:type I restriction enzyme M protein
MALKKSELYSSLWSSCDELRGGMDVFIKDFDMPPHIREFPSNWRESPAVPTSGSEG